MFENLMELPLFHGISREKLASLLEKIPFHFLKFAQGETIITEGDEANHVRFVVSGAAAVENNLAPDLTLSYSLQSPNVIAPEYLFGRFTAYPFHIKAQDTCGIMQITKADYISILNSDKIFLFNLLNYLSRNSQKADTFVRNTPLSTERLISNVILTQTTTLSTNITINFKMKALCHFLSARRPTVIAALNHLAEVGAIDHTANAITVLNRSLLTRTHQ